MIEPHLSAYSHIKLYTGDRGQRSNRLIEELYLEQFQEWGVPDLLNYIREQHGNITCHARLYGGPRQLDWYNPPKLLSAKKRDEEATGDARYIEMAARMEELEQRLAEKTVGKHSGPIKEVRFENVGEKPERTVVEQMFFGFFEELGPLFTGFILDKIKGTLLEHLQGVSMPQPNEQQPPIADINTGGVCPTCGASEVDLDIPEELLQYFNAVDWERTNWQGLLVALKQTNLLTLKTNGNQTQKVA